MTGLLLAGLLVPIVACGAGLAIVFAALMASPVELAAGGDVT